jgi:hypothetical protein
MKDKILKEKKYKTVCIMSGKDSVLSFLLAKEQGYKIDGLFCLTFHGRVAGHGDALPDKSWTNFEMINSKETMEESIDRFCNIYHPENVIIGNEILMPNFYRVWRRNKVKMIQPIMGMSGKDVVRELVKRKIKVEALSGEFKGQLIDENFLTKNKTYFDINNQKNHTKVIGDIDYGLFY